MIDINLEKNKNLIDALCTLGFKKRKGMFLRERDGLLQYIELPYNTYGVWYTRFYSLRCGFTFATVEDVAEKMGVLSYGTSTGHFHTKLSWLKKINKIPQRPFLEWEIARSDSEKKLFHQIKKIIDAVKKKAIPLLERFTDINSFVEAEEKGELKEMRFFYDYKWPPIIYRLLGQEDKAQAYISQRLKCLKETMGEDGTTYKWTPEYIEMSIRCNSDANYNNYMHFAQLFNETKGDTSIWHSENTGRYPFSLI